jgi:glycine cleavage system pyridoxal-binding protein P
MAYVRPEANGFFVPIPAMPKLLKVVQTRAKALGLRVIVDDHQTFKFEQQIFGHCYSTQQQMARFTTIEIHRKGLMPLKL